MIIDLAAGKSLLSQHAVHLLSVGIPVVMVVLGLGIDALRKSGARQSPANLRHRPLLVAAGALVCAALIHVWVAPEHFREAVLYGAFFACLSVAQLSAAWFVAAGRSRTVVAAVALGSAAVICLWLVTRVVAIPLGPDAGATESFGVLDVAASVLELVAVAGCLAALRPSPRRPKVAAASMPLLGERVLVP